MLRSSSVVLGVTGVPEGLGGKAVLSEVSALKELRQLLDLAEQCSTYARAVRRNMAARAQSYQVQAEAFKSQAARAHSAQTRERLLRIAASHERLARLADASRQLVSDIPEDPEPRPDSAPDPRIAEKSREGTVRRWLEDPVAQTRRHIAEAESHIARQDALITRLSGDERYAVLVEQAKDILDTLTHTRNLARQHLALELNK